LERVDVTAISNKNNQRNLYRILYVQPDAPLEIIRASYRTLMQKLKAHPDLGGDEWNAAVINKAFDVLSDTEKRLAYDAKLFGAKSKKLLGKQSRAQRRELYSLETAWHDFRPIKI
jgi:DnaJ-class molecular chaperone